jgi:predicted molibdopterin-dependent oxidoreductase YjgC
MPLQSQKLTTCTFCGVGCGIYLESSGDRITGAYPSVSHPANLGRICVRGWHVHEVASSPDRLKKPLIRKYNSLQPVSWNAAYDYIAQRLESVRRQHGPDAIGFVTSPRCSNEESYLLQKLARAVVGTNNVAHGVGLHRINSIEVLLEMLGVPAATSSIGELMNSDVIVVDGIDLGRQLPTIGGWVVRAKLAGSRLIATGSRMHRVAEHADCFLQIRPNTDVLLYGAMAKVIVDRGLADQAFVKAHCRDYEQFLKNIQAFDVLWAAERCGVRVEDIEDAAVLYGKARAAMILYSTGVEARGADAIRAIVNLALLTGNLGKKGAGILPLAEHNNLQGGCDMGMLPGFLPGYAPVTDASARARLGELWNAKLPSSPGADIRMLLRKGNGDALRALWLDRHDPLSWSIGADVETIQKLDFLLVQQIFMTEAARYAHVILPIPAFGEEQVSFTSTERRIQLTAKAVDPPAGLAPAWQQIVRVANRLGADWSYSSAADVMAEIGRAVPQYAAAEYDNLSRDYGRQWPCTSDKPLGTGDVFGDGLPPRALRFAALAQPHVPPRPPADYPFILVRGYSLYYWHQNVLVRHSETLKREYGILLLDYPGGFVEINHDDAVRLGLRDGAKIRLLTADGVEATTLARVTREVRSGMVFVPLFLQEMARKLLDVPEAEEDSTVRPVFVRIEEVK